MVKAEEVEDEVVDEVEEELVEDGKDGDKWEVEWNIFQLQEFMAELITINKISITHLQDIELKYLGGYSKFWTQIKYYIIDSLNIMNKIL